MTQTEAIKLAIEWIEKQPEETPESKYDVDTRYVVIREIEAALAQPHEMTVKEFNQIILDDPNYHQWLKTRRQNERISP